MFIPKADWERQMFTGFAAVAGLRVDVASILSRDPPEPDIAFALDGQFHFVELVEITDESLARRHSIALQKAVVIGGAFSQVVPLVDAFRRKSDKRYATRGAPLWLLAYYDKQFPAVSFDPQLIVREVGSMAAEMVESGIWQKVWVYDSWRQRILWVYPEK
jgi:hypothetical protein